VSLPTSDAQSSGFLPQRPRHPQAAPHSTAAAVPGHAAYPASVPHSPHAPVDTPRIPSSPFTGTPFPPPSSSWPAVEHADQIVHERAIDFASSSWDLATGGLKTLTAKRQLPPLPDRRLSEKLPEPADSQRNYAFLLVVLACIVLMLFSAGIVLWIIIFQP
jgi:hypothetical protein